jgi:catalase
VNYWGIHAFKLTNAKGQAQFAKWVFEPAGPEALLDDERLESQPDEFLANELRQRVATKPTDDPVLRARAGAYAESPARRLGGR